MVKDAYPCKFCDGSGVVSSWILWKKPCCHCSGLGEIRSPLYGLSEEEQRKVLRRNPDPVDLNDLGVKFVIMCWPPDSLE